MSSSPPAYTPPPPLPRPPALHKLALLPPVITSSEADFAAKLPLVQEVAAAYTRTPRLHAHALLGYTLRHESEYQAKTRNKEFTPSMHALLFSLSEDALQGLAADSLAAAAVCDRAQAFISMGMGHKSLMATAVNTGLVGPTLSWIPSVPRSTNIWNSSNLPAYTPGFEICILTGEPAGVQRVPIVPRGLLASDASAALFAGTSLITDALHGDGVAAWIGAELRRAGGSSQVWNSLPLSAYMRERYDAGDLAFRPRGVDAGCGGYRVHFSAHWLHETNIAWKGLNPGFCARPSPETVEYMLDTIPYGSNPGNGRGGMAEFSMFTGRFVRDGDVFSVGFATYDDARRMMCMLTFRWNVAVIFCLAGMEEWPQLDEDGEVSRL